MEAQLQNMEARCHFDFSSYWLLKVWKIFCLFLFDVEQIYILSVNVE